MGTRHLRIFPSLNRHCHQVGHNQVINRSSIPVKILYRKPSGPTHLSKLVPASMCGNILKPGFFFSCLRKCTFWTSRREAMKSLPDDYRQQRCEPGSRDRCIPRVCCKIPLRMSRSGGEYMETSRQAPASSSFTTIGNNTCTSANSPVSLPQYHAGVPQISYKDNIM